MKRTATITKIGILSACSLVLMIIAVPLPLIPPFLTLDLSDVPALLGAFAMGPLAGCLIQLVRCLLHLTVSNSGGIGELAAFIIGCGFVLPAGLVYRGKKTRQRAYSALLLATVSMTVFAALTNYFILLPLYQLFLGLSNDMLIKLAHAGNSHISSIGQFILFAIVPFNIIKGAVTSLVVILVYKRLSILLHQ